MLGVVPASNNDAASLDGTSKTDEEELQVHVLDILTSMNTSHPFMPIIDNEPNNPRLKVVERYLGLLRADANIAQGICDQCFADDSLSEEERTKNHRDHLSQHVWSCGSKSIPGFWRCPVCTEFIAPTAINIDGTEPLQDDQEAAEEAFEEHCEACFQYLLSELEADKEAVDIAEEEAELEDDDASSRSRSRSKSTSRSNS